MLPFKWSEYSKQEGTVELEKYYASIQGLATWVGLALIISGLADALNRSRVLWFVLGFFLGPIALLILVILGKDRSRYY